MWCNWSLQTLLEGMLNGAATLENSLAVSQNTEQSYQMIQQFNLLLDCGDGCITV